MKFLPFMVVALFSIWLWDKHPGVVVFGVLALAGLIAYVYFEAAKEKKEEEDRVGRMAPEERDSYLRYKEEQGRTIAYGPVNPHLVCPHCTTLGQVRSKPVTRQAQSQMVTNTIAGIKATSTSTTSVKQRHCDKCGTDWDVA